MNRYKAFCKIKEILKLSCVTSGICKNNTQSCVKYQWNNTQSFEFRTLPHQQISKGAAFHDDLATLKCLMPFVWDEKRWISNPASISQLNYIGGFPEMVVPPKWMVYNGKSHWNG